MRNITPVNYNNYSSPKVQKNNQPAFGSLRLHEESMELIARHLTLRGPNAIQGFHDAFIVGAKERAKMFPMQEMNLRLVMNDNGDIVQINNNGLVVGQCTNNTLDAGKKFGERLMDICRLYHALLS